jgi:outer membrane protein assembly factor BamB
MLGQTISPGENVLMQRSLFTFAVTWSFFLAATLGCKEQPRYESEAEPIRVADTDWPWWRGPHRNGIAEAKQTPPLKWSETENVLWKSPVPGRGHGSPTVVGDQVFLATADHEHETQSVLCYHRQTGKLQWESEIHRGGFTTKGNKKSSLASSTVACDGQRVFVNFLNAEAVYTTALSRDGQKLWQTKITDYVLHQGYGSSPALYESLVIVSADNKGGGAIAALDRANGKEIWKRKRLKTPNYPSPIILNLAGRDQLLLIGCDLVTSLDPLSGKQLWEIKGATTECVTSTVTDGQLIFSTGGYPKSHVAAVRADGSGQVVWEKKTRVYVPSMIALDGYLYAVLDSGMAVCWRSSTGEEMWKGRLGGTFSASLVLVDDKLFATNESGRTFIFKASPTAFKLVGENQLNGEVIATPAICGGRIYMRVANSDQGERQEMLYCLGKRE